MYLKNNKNCYKIKEYTFTNGMFDSSCDCCYVLTMENSKRKDKYMRQLDLFCPHSLVKIQTNEGFKKCNKILREQTVAMDILDAYYHVFLDAKHNQYNHILVFEDDFFFDESKFDIKDIQNINNFIKNINPDIYNLGPIVHYSHSYIFDSKHFISVLQATAHSVIYSRKYRSEFMNAYEKNKITDGADGMFFNHFKFRKFCYWKPICFQLMEKTESRKAWNNILVDFLLLLTKLDKSHKNYTITYHILVVAPIVIYALLIFLVVYIIFKMTR